MKSLNDLYLFMKFEIIPIVLLLLISSTIVMGQNVKAFYIGHSLSDQIPDMVASLSDDHSEVSFENWVYQTIPGAPLRWNWQAKDRNDFNPIEPFLYGYYHPEKGLKAGDFDALILTESVPRYMSIIEESYDFADSFFVYANTYNPNPRVFIYEVWHCINSGTPTGCSYDVNASPWRQRLTDDLPMWESIVDTLNARYSPETEVCLIPGGQGLARLYDEMLAGNVPGLNTLEDIFADDIHLNDIGKYFIACIHFSVLHQISPVGLKNQLHNMWGSPFTAPNQELALKLQELAWQTVTSYPGSCIEETSTGIKSQPELKSLITISPNPVNDILHLKYEGNDKSIKVFDVMGRLVFEETGRTFEISALNRGIYFIAVDNEVLKFMKQ